MIRDPYESLWTAAVDLLIDDLRSGTAHREKALTYIQSDDLPKFLRLAGISPDLAQALRDAAPDWPVRPRRQHQGGKGRPRRSAELPVTSDNDS